MRISCVVSYENPIPMFSTTATTMRCERDRCHYLHTHVRASSLRRAQLWRRVADIHTGAPVAIADGSLAIRTRDQKAIEV